MGRYIDRKELYRKIIFDFLGEQPHLEIKKNRDELFSLVGDLIELEILLGMERSSYAKN